MYKIAICDDNDNFIKELKELIEGNSQYPKEAMIFEYQSGEEFLRDIDNEHNLVFIDMQMEKLDGNETAKQMRLENKDAVLVFCSGTQSPEPEFFNVQAFRYLLKSYSRKRQEKEIEEILLQMRQKSRVVYFAAVHNGTAVKVKIDDILYIETFKRGSRIYVLPKTGEENKCRKIRSNRKLEDVYDELKKHGFEYAHNSYIVNLNYIESVKGNELILENNLCLNISRERKAVFHARFAEFLGRKYKRSRK